MSGPCVSAFDWVPDFARGLVRDLRVRWALEEAGIAYDSDLKNFEESKGPAYRQWQPFGQVPAYDDGQVRMFESGAIVTHIALGSEALMPRDEAGRARALTWIFAALNSIEPGVSQLAETDLFHEGEDWTKERRPQVEEELRQRLGELSAQLNGRDWLEDRFTAGDLMMSTVLRNLRQTSILNDYPVLTAYQHRCEARPAFQRALAAQLGDFKEAA
ncbi:glutathione S-transferase family protein [Sphingoaurantiacus capsulatus]|uniref:Glutathione S-transferase family protein n=1 Tax=Sphingoaurantiacus capsulatus TaxID=1771310 RepID=A0ABV7XDN4_9SPHN